MTISSIEKCTRDLRKQLNKQYRWPINSLQRFGVTCKQSKAKLWLNRPYSMEGLTTSSIAWVWGKGTVRPRLLQDISFDLENLILEMYPKENDWLCVQYVYEDVYIGFKK